MAWDGVAMWFLPSALNVKVKEFNQARGNGGSNYGYLKAFEKVSSSQEIMRKAILESRNTRFYEEDRGIRVSSVTELLRVQICKAFLLDNVSFNLLDNNHPESLVSVLNTFGGHLNARSVRDAIPLVYSIEMELIRSEIADAKCFGAIFDATPDRGEAFGVVLRWMNDRFEIHHRCISLIFYDQSFDHAGIGEF